ncbi:MAG TPA: fumarylacetoacetate hydrolase family protein [Stellaceae bacterium]|nr:fumarylacetoacetate hydrolase family protein [Stellaceae bacterium]
MPTYQLATCEAADGPRAGVVIDERVYELAAQTSEKRHANLLGYYADWPAAERGLERVLADGPRGAARPLAQTRLLAPLLYPGAIYCAGANYSDHAAEMNARQGRPPDPDPHTLGLKAWHFIKASRSVTHPDAAVALPRASKSVDWEVELAAVIGRAAKDVPETDALQYVAGYTIGNDLSARDLGFREQLAPANPFRTDWLAHKSFDGSCPLGPWIVPASAIGDPQTLGLKLWVNDVLKQDSNTSKMIYTLAEQIAQLSSRITLHPGDVIMTGTPAGVGAGRGEFLKPGDVVRLWIDKIGTLTNRMA